MHYLTSRFTNSTWNETLSYRNNMNIKCLYGSTEEISSKIPIDSHVYVIEMNNDINQILGIGIIKNRHKTPHSCKIYSNYNYNRYVYQGTSHLTRDTIIKQNKLLVEKLEKMLFKGKSHMKRGSGLTEISNNLLNKLRDDFDIKYSINNLTFDK